jgi:hypothetical protein
MKEGSLFVLFCTDEIHRTRMLQITSWSLWEALKEKGAWAWFHGVWTCCVEVVNY